jgi:hypothetical protein
MKLNKNMRKKKGILSKWVKIKISPKKLINGGNPKLIRTPKSHNRGSPFLMTLGPILKKRRLLLFEYGNLMRKNNKDEIKPWPNKINNLPKIENVLPQRNLKTKIVI